MKAIMGETYGRTQTNKNPISYSRTEANKNSIYNPILASIGGGEICITQVLTDQIPQTQAKWMKAKNYQKDTSISIPNNLSDNNPSDYLVG